MVFTSSAGQTVVVDSPAAGPENDGYFETNFGWHYEAWMNPAATVTAEVFEPGVPDPVSVPPCTSQCTPRAFNAWVFFPADEARPANSASLSHHDLWWGTQSSPNPAHHRVSATDTLAIPTAAGRRYVGIEINLTDLTADGRTAMVTASAGGQSVTRTYNSLWPAYEEELMIDRLVLAGVPGATTSVDVTFTSPDGTDVNNAHLDGGDSFFVSGVTATPGLLMGGQGCDHKFWRRQANLDEWVYYRHYNKFSDVFGRAITGDPSLRTALFYKPGDEARIARIGVAALLNASSLDVNYLYTEAEVIQFVQDALDGVITWPAFRDLLMTENDMGCSIDENLN